MLYNICENDKTKIGVSGENEDHGKVEVELIETINIDKECESMEILSIKQIHSDRIIIEYKMKSQLLQIFKYYNFCNMKVFASLKVINKNIGVTDHDTVTTTPSTTDENDSKMDMIDDNDDSTITIDCNVDNFTFGHNKYLVLPFPETDVLLNHFQKKKKSANLFIEFQIQIKNKYNGILIASSKKKTTTMAINKQLQTKVNQYKCIFTKCNGIGRFGPTRLDYNKQCNQFDTILDFQQKGMQLWKVPQSGNYNVICYGAKGGDSKANDKRLFGGRGAKVGGILKLYQNDIIKIVIGQQGMVGRRGGGGGGGTYFVLYKIGNNNPNFKENEIVNIPLIIASGGNGACSVMGYSVNGIDGLCNMSENRDNYGGYKSNGLAARGGSFKNDFDMFKSYCDSNNEFDHNYNKYNPLSFMDGSIGGVGTFYGHNDGGFGGGGGGGGGRGGGGAGGYIGGLVSSQDRKNSDRNKYKLFGALSYNMCQNKDSIIAVSGVNNTDGKIELEFVAK